MATSADNVPVTAAAMIAALSEYLGVDVASEPSLERDLAVYLTCRESEESDREIAAAFGSSHAQIARIRERIDLVRQLDPLANAAVKALEHWIAGVAFATPYELIDDDVRPTPEQLEVWVAEWQRDGLVAVAEWKASRSREKALAEAGGP